MSKPSTATQLKDCLLSFGRYVRAGHDNIINYFSMWLASGPQTDELRAIFRDPPDWLVVDRAEDGRVIRVGLTAWLDQADIETDTTPSSEQELWDLILQLRAAMVLQASRLEGLEEELEIAHQLMGEDASTHQCSPVLPSPLVHCEHGDLPGKLAEVEARLAGVNSAQGSLREAYDKVIAERNELRKELKPLRPALEKWEKFRDDPSSDMELMHQLAATLMERRMSVLEIQYN